MPTEILELLQQYQIDITPNWDNKFIRNDAQWFIGQRLVFNSKEIFVCTFGDFRQDLRKTWKSSDATSTNPEETLKIKQYIDSMKAQEQEAKEKLHSETALKLELEFSSFATDGEHPYLARKKIEGDLYGARLTTNDAGHSILCVPLRDETEKLWNYQRIYSQKLSSGDKFFIPGARIEGLFHLLLANQSKSQGNAKNGIGEKASTGDGSSRPHGTSSVQGDAVPGNLELREVQARSPENSGRADATRDTVYICEGYATAVSIQKACPENIVVAAFSAGNLSHVALKIRDLYPTKRIIIACDNDAYTLIGGKPTNIGILKGRQAAALIGAEVRYPVFTAGASGLTDFNDLLVQEGIDAVARGLAQQVQEVIVKKGLPPPMDMVIGKNQKEILPTEKACADYILSRIGHDLVAQGDAVFRYTGTHWVELSEGGISALKQYISASLRDLPPSYIINSYYKTLLMHMRQVPDGVNMYQPNPYIANFSDKTMHLLQEGNDFKVIFEPHLRTDYITSVLPFRAPSADAPDAPKFHAMLERLWNGEPEKENIIRLVRQIMGACLVQAFPIVVFFQGKSGSGKSSIIKLMVHLLNHSNVCTVGPTEMYNFLMESMVAKLLNYDTDIDTSKYMCDSVLKKINDKTPIQINRKGRLVIEAYIPAIHLFGCNQLPKTRDGASKAYQRRFTVIATNNVVSKDEEIKDFTKVLVGEEMDGIVAWAYGGLLDLMQRRGEFIRLKSSEKLIENIQSEGDTFEEFMSEIAEGEFSNKAGFLQLGSEKDAVPRSQVWEVFNQWQKECATRFCEIGKHKFNERMVARGFSVDKHEGKLAYFGLKFEANPGSIA